MFLLCTETGREAYGGRSGYAELGYFTNELAVQQAIRFMTSRMPEKTFYYVRRNMLVNPSNAQLLDLFRDY